MCVCGRVCVGVCVCMYECVCMSVCGCVCVCVGVGVWKACHYLCVCVCCAHMIIPEGSLIPGGSPGTPPALPYRGTKINTRYRIYNANYKF